MEEKKLLPIDFFQVPIFRAHKKQSEDTKLVDRETLEFIHELSSWLSAGLIGGGQFELHTRRRARNYPRLIDMKIPAKL
jgi:hypothetical protein